MRNVGKFATITLICLFCLGMSIYLLIDTWQMKEALRNIDKGWFATKILERELSHEQMSNIFLCIISFTIVICGSYMIIYVKECAEESIEKEGREAE